MNFLFFIDFDYFEERKTVLFKPVSSDASLYINWVD